MHLEGFDAHDYQHDVEYDRRMQVTASFSLGHLVALQSCKNTRSCHTSESESVQRHHNRSRSSVQGKKNVEDAVLEEIDSVNPSSLMTPTWRTLR